MIFYNSNSLSDLDYISKEISKKIIHKVICLTGEVGSGKTTLVKAILSNFEINSRVNSPTFSIVNEYKNLNNLKFYHFDFYRINSIEEAFDFGFEEYLESNNYCFIEWPNIILDFLPLEYHEINIDKTELNTRIISFK